MSKIYSMIPLINLDRNNLLQVLNIRNEENIRKRMFNEDIISADSHFTWIEHIKTAQNQIHFAIISENSPCGVVNLKKIDTNNKTAELGFYKTQNLNEKGLMTECLNVLMDYSFDILKLEKIYSEVFEGNIKSINIHKKLFFIEEGFLRSHAVKGGLRIGIHLFGLLKSEWAVQKTGKNLNNNFKVEIKNYV